ncbi:MAG: tetratricopeptide repeat protein [Bizionia paragorgiae]|uniref:tetratricopeptide repeat protein n=1 Tax=Bizionia paragorgiae TaxID=283786 RepID=UPI003C5A2A7B
MKYLYFLLFTVIVCSCSDKPVFSETFQQQTTGHYLFHPDAEIEVHYDNNKLLIDWLGVKDIEPLLLDNETFYIKEMNKKMRFVQNPSDGLYYLSEVMGDESVTYDYRKQPDSIRVPSYYLHRKAYDKALKGYLELQSKDSSLALIEEVKFNRFGYNKLSSKAYEEAIAIFKINVALYPKSANVYDSLADAYLRSGDSLQAYNNYSKSLALDSANPRAQRYIKAYNNE